VLFVQLAIIQFCADSRKAGVYMSKRKHDDDDDCSSETSSIVIGEDGPNDAAQAVGEPCAKRRREERDSEFWNNIESSVDVICDIAAGLPGQQYWTNFNTDTLILHLITLRAKVLTRPLQRLSSPPQHARVVAKLTDVVRDADSRIDLIRRLELEIAILTASYETFRACLLAATWPTHPPPYWPRSLTAEAVEAAEDAASDYGITRLVSKLIKMFRVAAQNNVDTSASTYHASTPYLTQRLLTVAECIITAAGDLLQVPQTMWDALLCILPIPVPRQQVDAISLVAALTFAAISINSDLWTSAQETIVPWMVSTEVVTTIEHRHMQMASNVQWWSERMSWARQLTAAWIRDFTFRREGRCSIATASDLVFAKKRALFHDPSIVHDKRKKIVGNIYYNACREMFILPDLPTQSSVVTFLASVRRLRGGGGLPNELCDMILRLSCCPPYHGNHRTMRQRLSYTLLQCVWCTVGTFSIPDLQTHFPEDRGFIWDTYIYNVTELVP